jgi:hypothetical protein
MVRDADRSGRESTLLFPSPDVGSLLGLAALEE